MSFELKPFQRVRLNGESTLRVVLPRSVAKNVRTNADLVLVGKEGFSSVYPGKFGDGRWQIEEVYDIPNYAEEIFTLSALGQAPIYSWAKEKEKKLEIEKKRTDLLTRIDALQKELDDLAN